MAGEVNVLRNDEPGGMLSQEEALQNATVHNNRFFLVPKVIKKDEA
jgi:aspartyl/glutamyl-tRNA(Asn/Gln) amidotransferase C subunit